MCKIKVRQLSIIAVVIIISICIAPAASSSNGPDRNGSKITDPFKPLNSANTVVPQAGDKPIVVPDLYVKTVMLKFLKADNLALAIRSMSSPFGAITTDQDSNSVIICDTEEKVERIIRQIRLADQTPRQILIEVVIVDVQLNDDTEIGVNWNHIFGDNANDFATVFGNAATPDYSGSVHDQALNINLGGGLTTGGAFALLHNGLAVTIKALQTTRNLEILASPRVLVVSGESAVIKTVEEIPYTDVSQTSQGGNLTSTEFKEVGVTLTVAATITDDGQIMLKIEPEQSVNTGRFGIDDVPIVDTRSASTTLLMEDGQAVALGGLRRKETTHTKNKVPVLGDLPLVGGLFSNDQSVTKNSELLVMLSPHIYKGDALTKYQRQKFDEMSKAKPIQLPKESRPEYEAVQETMPTIIE